MFKQSIFVSACCIIITGLTGCTASMGINTNDAGSADEPVGAAAGSGGSSSRGGASSIGGRSSNSTTGYTGIGGSSAVSCIKLGPITSDTTWEPLTSCPNGFDVPELIVVEGMSTTLTIKPGTVLKFASGSGIEVDESAALVAIGTAANAITFTGWQKVAGSWSGISFFSSALKNEVSYAVVEYGGEPNGASAGIVVSHDIQYSSVKLTNNQIHDNGKFGLTVYSGCGFSSFENNTITKNGSGAIRVEAPSVHQLMGKGNSLTNNGNGNTVRLETNSLLQVKDIDVTWPNLSPAAYRVTDVGGTSGAPIYIRRHVTIESGAVFEFVGGSGIDISDGTSGLSAIGTSTAPIIFRGVDGSGWTGIGFCESSWAGNALEEVQIQNAAGCPPTFLLCGSGAEGVRCPGVLVGHVTAPNASNLRVKNIKVSGPNSAPSDIFDNLPSTLTQEGTNSGTGANGALTVQAE